SLRRKRLFQELDDNERKILLQDQTLPKYWKKGDPDDSRCDSRHMEDRLAGTGFDLRTTFGDVEGQSLCFMSVKRPYKRCLNLQARLSRKKAIQEAWIQPNEDEFEDFWSEGMSLAEKMAFFSASDN
ncbi:Crinkler (CRN), partial [Phytophthora megakarya]